LFEDVGAKGFVGCRDEANASCGFTQASLALWPPGSATYIVVKPNALVICAWLAQEEKGA
jgi:hypothetical protein